MQRPLKIKGGRQIKGLLGMAPKQDLRIRQPKGSPAPTGCQALAPSHDANFLKLARPVSESTAKAAFGRHKKLKVGGLLTDDGTTTR